MRLYFVRHGESEANTLRVISNRESQYGLTVLGRQQAAMLVDHLKAVPFTAIYSSPILRARETAEIVAQAFDLPCQITEALREYDCGILEDCSDEESWKEHQSYYNDWMLRCRYEAKPIGGENFLKIQERFLPFIDHLKPRKDEHLLLVGHGGLFHLMLPRVLMNVENEFVKIHGLGHAECVIAEWHANGWLCRQWGQIIF